MTASRSNTVRESSSIGSDSENDCNNIIINGPGILLTLRKILFWERITFYNITTRIFVFSFTSFRITSGVREQINSYIEALLSNWINFRSANSLAKQR